jgi:plastocyanin/mono/diheme cytochrome c family protein
MGNSRNPGYLAIIVGVALGVLFGLLGFTGVLEGRIGFGLMAVSLVAAALVYIFYSRNSAIEKTGYGALLFIIAVALIIPFLTVSQQQAQANQTKQTYMDNLTRGAETFGQYCSTCHGFLGQGIVGPRLNNNPVVNKLSDQDILGIISGGVRNPSDPSKYLMPAWLDSYGGSLTENDISYLIALIRSSDPAYRQAHDLASVNGFDLIYGTLTNPTQIADYKQQEAQLKAGATKPPASAFTDLTSQTTVTIDAQDTSANSSGFGWFAVGAKPASNAADNATITIKVGTKVTWTNKSSAFHNVVSGVPGQPPQNAFPQSPLLAANSSDTYSFTFTKAGDYPFYCGIHPTMIGFIEVKP